MNTKYKIIFFGTPEFSAIILEKLIISDFKPVALVTAPDKPVGRKQIITPSPIKKLGLKYNLPIFQWESLKSFEATKTLFDLQPDLFIIAAYGLILPQELLNIPKFGSLNIHPSLLPKYRGASPIQAAILAGDKKTGVTIILMDEKIDHGPIVAQKELKTPIFKIPYPELNTKLAILGADLLINVLPEFLAKGIQLTPQDHSKATFSKQITKDCGKIDWQKTAEEIERMFLAYHPWPGIYSLFNNKILKLLEIQTLKIKHQYLPGTVFLTSDKELAVACKENALILKRVQLEGKTPVSGGSFLNGHQKIIKNILG